MKMAGINAAQAGQLGLKPSGALRARLSPAPIFKFARAKPLGAFSALILIVFIIVAVFAPRIAPYSPTSNNSHAQLQGPSAQHLFGTDQYGRDVFSRIIYGARVSLVVGIGATLVGGLIATAIGIASAYFGGAADYVIQRLVDAVQAIPAIILLIGILVILGPSLTNVIIALAARSAITSSRVKRSSALTILGQPYVDAGRVLGASHTRIMVHYILPNIMATVIVLASVNFGAAILAEASLAFLGYSVPPPIPSWGSMLSAEGRTYMFVGPWLLIAPAAVLTAVVFAANMFGDALRDVLDPRLRQASGQF
jgi:peptide/nickel transport system permease protein